MSKQGFLGPRRLRLILLAFLRGYLKPGRPKTINDVVREQFIFDAIEIDNQVKAITHMTEITSGAMSVMTPQNARKAYQEQVSRVRVIEALLSLDIKTAAHGGMKDVDELTEIYHALEKSGFLDQI